MPTVSDRETASLVHCPRSLTLRPFSRALALPKEKAARPSMSEQEESMRESDATRGRRRPPVMFKRRKEKEKGTDTLETNSAVKCD